MISYILAPEALQDLQELWDYIALDAGALGLSDELHILVSCDVNGQTMLEEFIHRFAGQRLRLPQPSYPPPAHSYIAWHRKEVFRALPGQIARRIGQERFTEQRKGKNCIPPCKGNKIRSESTLHKRQNQVRDPRLSTTIKLSACTC